MPNFLLRANLPQPSLGCRRPPLWHGFLCMAHGGYNQCLTPQGHNLRFFKPQHFRNWWPAIGAAMESCSPLAWVLTDSCAVMGLLSSSEHLDICSPFPRQSGSHLPDIAGHQRSKKRNVFMSQQPPPSQHFFSTQITPPHHHSSFKLRYAKAQVSFLGVAGYFAEPVAATQSEHVKKKVKIYFFCTVHLTGNTNLKKNMKKEPAAAGYF